MKKTLLTVVAASLVTLVLCGGLGGAPIYDIWGKNAYVKTALQVDGTTTTNNTQTAAGAVVKSSTTKAHGTATLNKGATSTVVSGSFTKSTYTAELEPTLNTSRDTYITSKTATSFTINHPTISNTSTADWNVTHF